ncbi:hypothetical protein TPELBph1_CDS0055 [Terrisporobacter phage TPELB_ph1]
MLVTPIQHVSCRSINLFVGMTNKFNQVRFLELAQKQ